MLDHFGNFTEINPPSLLEYELRLRKNARAQAQARLKEFVDRRNSSKPGNPRRSLLDRIIQLFGAPSLF